MKIFILGILFVCFILPLVESIVTFINNYIEYHNYLLYKQIYKIKQQMNEQEEQQSNNPIGFATNVVGFDIDNFEEQDEDEEE